MFEVKVDKSQVEKLARQFPAQVMRAAEISLDKTADAIRDAERAELPKVFDRPTPYTLNSLKVTKTQGHNMTACVWFKEPDRMIEHYLVPQVFGGPRRQKGFERAFGGYFVPSKAESLDRYGNMPYGRIVQILSVLGRAEYKAGYSANVTARSRKRNRKPRDYVLLTNQHGKLPAGIYQRFQTGAGFGAKTKKTLPFGEYQKGATRGKFSSVVRARGLRPVLIQVKRPGYSKRLPFFEIGRQVFDRQFNATFLSEFGKQMGQR
jgi:hypothetical protein